VRSAWPVLAAQAAALAMSLNSISVMPAGSVPWMVAPYARSMAGG
jgi:hypothetical protein